MTLTIPKTIHYVWVGGAPKNELALRCIESWKKYMPDYQIVEWNENNFDIDMIAYTKEAYNQKKWAFVSDAVRTYALKEYGGVYFDTDVELFCPPGDIFQNADVVLGFENSFLLSTGVMAAIPNHPVFEKLWGIYTSTHFKNVIEESTINTKITGLIVDFTGRRRITDGYHYINGVKILPREYFSDNNANNVKPVFAIHYFAGTWKTKTELTYFQFVMFRMKFILLRMWSVFLGNKIYLRINDGLWSDALIKTAANKKREAKIYRIL